MKRDAKGAKRWVVKLGTGILTNASGQIDIPQIEQLTAQIAALRKRGYQVVVVSSGAVGCGMSLLKMKKPVRKYLGYAFKAFQLYRKYRPLIPL